MDERTRKSSGTTRQDDKIRARPKEPDQHRMVRIGREEMVHQGDRENAIWRSR